MRNRHLRAVKLAVNHLYRVNDLAERERCTDILVRSLEHLVCRPGRNSVLAHLPHPDLVDRGVKLSAYLFSVEGKGIIDNVIVVLVIFNVRDILVIAFRIGFYPDLRVCGGRNEIGHSLGRYDVDLYRLVIHRHLNKSRLRSISDIGNVEYYRRVVSVLRNHEEGEFCVLFNRDQPAVERYTVYRITHSARVIGSFRVDSLLDKGLICTVKLYLCQESVSASPSELREERRCVDSLACVLEGSSLAFDY